MTPGASDLHVAPAFVDAENGDLHLSPDSALIDAGTNIGIPLEDLDGEPRPSTGMAMASPSLTSARTNTGQDCTAPRRWTS